MTYVWTSTLYPPTPTAKLVAWPYTSNPHDNRYGWLT